MTSVQVLYIPILIILAHQQTVCVCVCVCVAIGHALSLSRLTCLGPRVLLAGAQVLEVYDIRPYLLLQRGRPRASTEPKVRSRSRSKTPDIDVSLLHLINI